MRKYRLVLLLKSDLSKDAEKKLIDDVKAWMGKPEKETFTDMGEKKLAYAIKKEKSAYYVMFDFEMEKVPEAAEKRIEIADSILRHLLVRMD